MADKFTVELEPRHFEFLDRMRDEYGITRKFTIQQSLDLMIEIQDEIESADDDPDEVDLDDPSEDDL